MIVKSFLQRAKSESPQKFVFEPHFPQIFTKMFTLAN